MEPTAIHDPLAEKLMNMAQTILVIVFGLSPLFFIPSGSTPFEFTKVLFVFAGLVLALIVASLSVLRSSRVSIIFSGALLSFWVVVIVGFVSALLSGDLKDALIGDTLSTHTTVFLGILALTMTVWGLVGASKSSIMRLYILLIISSVVLVLFHLLRLVFGTDVLQFGVFNTSASTPIGGWNDLALYLGLTILLSLFTLKQLRPSRQGRMFFTGVIAFSLVMLAVINFLSVWIVLGLVSLVVLVYSLKKDPVSFSEAHAAEKLSKQLSSLMPSIMIFGVSLIFVIGGSGLGGVITKYTKVSFVEVRPSLEATSDIARQVYEVSPVLGTGPNKFADAWRMYKDPAINQTVFWNTDFVAGNGYIPTFFITTGVLGTIAWLVFLAWFMYFGLRMVFKASDADPRWYYIGVSSFVGAVYIWIMAIIYVPGAVILMLGALFTGLAITAGSALKMLNTRTFAFGANKRIGFVATLLVIAVIVGSIQALYSVSQHYSAVRTFNKANQSVQAGVNLAEIEAEISRAYETSSSDVYARRVAELQLSRLNSLLALPNPTQADQQIFQETLVNGISSAKLATEQDETNPMNWGILGSIYSLLVSANIEGSYAKASESLLRAQELDPQNPLRSLALAQLEGRANNPDASRDYAEKAITLKSNYSDAYLFLTQLEIANGNIDRAIESTRATISLEPNNASRYYQLGVLESSRENLPAAVQMFEEAVRLSPDYANARYFLALSYDAIGRPADARAQFVRVLELNPGNKDVEALIATIDQDGSLGGNVLNSQSVNEDAGVFEDTDGTVSTTEDPGSSLLTPVNIVPDVGSETESLPEDEETIDELNGSDE